MKTKTNAEILESDFNDLSKKDQDKFLDLSIEKINDKYGKLIPKGSRTHTLVIENGMGCIIHHPKPSVLSKAMGALGGLGEGEPDMYAAGCAILINGWIAGDKQLEFESDERFAIAMQAVSIAQVMQGLVKKN